MPTTEERANKRRKTDDALPSALPAIKSSEQLHQNFGYWKSSSSSQLKAALDQFSNFLSQLSVSNKTDGEYERRLAILSKYCKEQSSASHDEVDFPDLLAIWSHASETNDESLLASIPSVLAQFYQSIDTSLDLRDFGISLGHSLLKRDQLRLFDKCLSSPRSKQHLIAPALRLLTKLIEFDQGTLATNVFNRRDHLYRRLDDILGRSQTADESPSVAHRSALEFLIANLKYIDNAAKIELISHGSLIYSAIRGLSTEQPNIVCATLRALVDFILDDPNMGGRLKSRCFNSGILTALAKLYAYDRDVPEDDSSLSVRAVLHEVLTKICTSSDIVNPQYGWYPVGFNANVAGNDGDMVPLGLDAPYFTDEYAERIPVKNGVLSVFLQTLRPGEDVLHNELILSVFSAAPELVADYFTKRTKFNLQPGDTPLWRGQFAFLFSIVQLSVPENFGWPDVIPQNPPPLSVIIENILPRPLDKSNLSKCLLSKDTLLIMSTMRYMTIALQKLKLVLEQVNQASRLSDLWAQASTSLISLFSERFPPLQEVIGTMSDHKESEQIRGTILECIATHYDVLPSISVVAKFDAAPFLTTAIKNLVSRDLDAYAQGTLNEQILHLLNIASRSSTTRWWQKPSPEDLSPVTSLLRFCTRSPESSLVRSALSILQDVLVFRGILNASRSLDVLILSLTESKKYQPELATYEFLDNCMTRTMQRPVKYLDRIEIIQDEVSDKAPLSLLTCCVAEQWPFVAKKASEDDVKNIAGWIARFFVAMGQAGENLGVMTVLQQEMLNLPDEYARSKKILTKALEKQLKKPIELSSPIDAAGGLEAKARSSVVDTVKMAERLFPANDLDLNTVFSQPPPIPQSLTGLFRWEKSDFDTEIQSGRLANLIRCTISPSHEVRIQAFHTLQTVAHSVENSNYSEKTQLYLLLGELSESIRSLILTGSDGGERTSSSSPPPPPPSLLSELAIHFLPVLSDPSSPLYSKTNEFLLLGPSWTSHRLIPYWTRQKFLTETTSDDTPGTNAQHAEIAWFLDFLIMALRTTLDLDLYRRAQVFTGLFSYYVSPASPKETRRRILQLVYRALQIPGGSDTLITRVGVREWLAVARNVRDHSGNGVSRMGKVDVEMRRIIDALSREVMEKCDRDGIAKWEAQRPIDKKTHDAGVVEEMEVD
ncbi:hypothetical protein PV10_05126 [Exophiala mesophila]|uniref:Nucleolar pre-ribosomal-associated protein 1 C-terminal domain-containing protein n=1 Tax=Exophiala mesophila TaxID=212818 RepID=A0A0D1WX43_EXOME|nr:uncharacterized protein PV10_05126 [Exophiala mesophila]KIV93955.1 hypothetical protein PV10_05126 [Exophiala mesophila]